MCFGLLQCAHLLLPVGQGLSFHFVHLTIQEFLAALHLVTLPNKEKLRFALEHANQARFSMVWRFAFGLGCKKNITYSKKVIYLDEEVYVVRHLLLAGNELQLCHYALESIY